MTTVLFVLTIPAVALAVFYFLMCFVGLCENIVEHLTTKNTSWDLLNKMFITGCVSGVIGAVFFGIILLLN